MQMRRWLTNSHAKETDSGPVTYVVGDIHGCLEPLERLLTKIAPRSDDEVVFVGDYIDRGPQSREVVDRLLGLPFRCVFLLGNHERMLLDFLAGEDEEIYLENGGGRPWQATAATPIVFRPPIWHSSSALSRCTKPPITCSSTQGSAHWSQ